MRPDCFLYVGRIEKMKGIDILFQAWNQIEKVQGENAPKLMVCGIGPMEEWCNNYIRTNSLKSVKMLGFVPNREVRKIMLKSKAVILPTQCYEGFPMVIIEAYSVGIPVIGSNIGNTGSLIKEGVAGLCFQYDDAESLIQAVEWMRQNEFDNIAEYYQKNYSEERNYVQILSVYANIS